MNPHICGEVVVWCLWALE